MAEKTNLTEDRIQAMTPPATGERFLWDSKVPGFGVRCFPSGRKVFVLMYRVAGGGRAATRQRVTIGDVNKVSLAKARTIAQTHNGDIAGGLDPRAEMRESKRREAARLDVALAAYDRYLKRRQVENRAQCISALKRGMPQPLDKIDLASVDRRMIAERIEKIAVQSMQQVDTKTKAGKTKRIVGGPAAAAQFRSFAHTFLSWAADQGLIQANPIAGWRRPRTTRAELVKQPGRSISDGEIKSVWSACAKVANPYGDFVRILLLTGQRRTETARMRWRDVDLGQGVWTIPAGVAKNGREHAVPLPPIVSEILSRQERFNSTDYVFSGRGGVPLSGWSKRQAALVKESGVAFKLHDLRKTFRSGLSRLGVDLELAEMMLNHKRGDLIEIYDREQRSLDRQKASESWADHVAAVVAADCEDNVVQYHAQRLAHGARTPV